MHIWTPVYMQAAEEAAAARGGEGKKAAENAGNSSKLARHVENE